MSPTDTACAAIDVLAAQLKAILRSGNQRGTVTINFADGEVSTSEVRFVTGSRQGWRFPTTIHAEGLTRTG